MRFQAVAPGVSPNANNMSPTAGLPYFRTVVSHRSTPIQLWTGHDLVCLGLPHRVRREEVVDYFQFESGAPGIKKTFPLALIIDRYPAVPSGILGTDMAVEADLLRNEVQRREAQRGVAFRRTVCKFGPFRCGQCLPTSHPKRRPDRSYWTGPILSTNILANHVRHITVEPIIGYQPRVIRQKILYRGPSQ